jgi:DNA gyrase subunit A
MDAAHNTVIPIKIEDEMRTSFLDYSMSVIVSRALPDVRDGLKPVHRRILYAMHGLKNYHNRPYLKSARIVGDVIGRYHPHGDSSVYEALVRLAQDFAMRYTLVDGQGNFGSIDGDSAAAMRYTESRLEEIAELLLTDIDKETVDFGPNYDNKEEEPLVLPTRLPQLLVNGASGIAVGMATNIPPHNLSEVLDALLVLIDAPETRIEDLMKIVKGPDFPTNGQIVGVSGIREAFLTGRGSIIMRAKANIEDVPKSNGRERIIVTEIPYQVNKARLIERIAELVRDKKIDGISDLRDESAESDIRIVIELKKGEMAEIMLNNLFKLTPMQTSFGVNMVCLVNGAPKLVNLKTLLEQFYLHRREVIVRKTAFELRQAEAKGHVLLGLKIAVENIDEVVSTIRKSPDAQVAHEQLITRFELSDIQAKSILEMRLSKLTGLERDKIIAEYNETMALITDLQDILATPSRVTTIIKDDFVYLREKFGDARRTEIIADAADEFTMESLVADEEVAVTVTHAGYIKRTPSTEIRAQKRGGKGKSGMLTKEEDVVKSLFMTSNHQSLLCFTNKGRVYDIKVYQVPEAPLRSRGKHFANIIKLEEGEKVVSVLPVKVFEDGKFIVSVTAQGYIKKTELLAYDNIRSSGIIGLKLEDGDTLVSCAVTTGKNDIIIATKQGKAIRFNEEETRPMGRSARGVTGIRFGEEEDAVIGMEVIEGESSILTVCENGFGKRSPLDEYRQQTRGGKGIYTIKVSERNGCVVGILQVSENDDLMIMTSGGNIVRFNVNELGVISRHTQGVKLMNVDNEEKVISVCKVIKFEGEEV